MMARIVLLIAALLLVGCGPSPEYQQQRQAWAEYRQTWDDFEKNRKTVRICRSGSRIYEHRGKLYDKNMDQLHGAAAKDICD
jgi:major membrane immunogen (membrane-anchored lipoprotein)